MKRRRMRVALAAGALSLSLAIAGCGQQATTTTTESAVEQKDAAEKFVGEWKLAYVEAEDITVAGDLEALMDESAACVLNISAGDKGDMALAGETISFTWKLKDDNTATITQADDADLEGASIIYRDGEIGIEFPSEEEDASSIEDVLSMGMWFFTEDGTSDKANVPDVGAATDISSADALVGDWKIAGYGTGGLVLACDPNSKMLTDTFGDVWATASFKDDGTCVLFEEESTWEIKDGVASIVGDDASIEMKLADDYLVVFLGTSSGEGDSMFVLYAK